MANYMVTLADGTVLDFARTRRIARRHRRYWRGILAIRDIRIVSAS